MRLAAGGQRPGAAGQQEIGDGVHFGGGRVGSWKGSSAGLPGGTQITVS
jgi:hypothetical protein